MIRVNEKMAVPVATLMTLILALVSALFWLRKHIKVIKPFIRTNT